jgi:hypothetical protein
LLIKAGYPVIYIISHEEGRVLDNIARIVRMLSGERKDRKLPPKKLVRWFAGGELRLADGLEPASMGESRDWLAIPGYWVLDKDGKQILPKEDKQGGEKAEDALQLIRDAKASGFGALSDTVAVFWDVHASLLVDTNTNVSGDLVRPLRNAAHGLRQYYDDNIALSIPCYKTIIIVAPSAAKLSPELERDLIQVRFPLPEHDELLRVVSDMAGKGRLKFPAVPPPEEVNEVCQGAPDEYQPRLCDRIANAGRGLTLEDFRSGLNMFAVSQPVVSSALVRAMLDLKSKAISSPALQYTPEVKVELGGLMNVKAWIGARREAASRHEVRQRYRLPPPRGLMLLGVSGGGKSQLAKSVADEFNLALLRLDVGSLFGSYIGESEERTRQALELAEILAPVVLWVDEIDKAFRGLGGGGDSGVSARVFGHFLTWLAEKEESVFVVTTANKFDDMLKEFPELSRKGRFDEIFWVDLPKEEEREAIFRVYLQPLADPPAFLTINDGEVEGAAEARGLAGLDLRGSNVEKLCKLLAQATFSENLTGAEIEYAITEAKYLAYGEGAPMRVRHVVPAVEAAMSRALYSPKSDLGKELVAQRDKVDKNKWFHAG